MKDPNITSIGAGSLSRRILTAVILLPPLFALAWAGGLPFTLLVLTAALLGLWEFHRLAQAAGAQPAMPVAAAWVALVIFNAHYNGPFLLGITVGGTLLTLAWVLARRERQLALASSALTIAGPLYLALPLSLAILLRRQAYGLEWLLFVLAVTFATDTFAYFTGKAIGRRKMAPSVSPGKTWEGAAGGMLAAVGAAAIIWAVAELPLALWKVLLLAASASAAGQVGDLAESMLKRSAQAKEASGLLPGHGGILDRLDSLVFAIVVVYYGLKLASP